VDRRGQIHGALALPNLELVARLVRLCTLVVIFRGSVAIYIQK